MRTPLTNLLTTIVITLLGVNTVYGSERSEFSELFRYELQNRALALVAVNKAAEKRKDKPDGEFWALYSQLEQFNQKRYSPYAEKYQLRSTMTVATKFKLMLSGIYGAVFHKHHTSLLAKATARYVEQLQRLESLAPAEDKAFFSYVVMQEKVQSEGLHLLSQNKPGLAIEKLKVLSSVITPLETP